MYIVDMSSLGAPWQNDPYKNQHAEQQKTRKTPRHNRHLEDFFFLYFVFICSFLNDFSMKFWVTAMVRSVTFIGV